MQKVLEKDGDVLWFDPYTKMRMLVGYDGHVILCKPDNRYKNNFEYFNVLALYNMSPLS